MVREWLGNHAAGGYLTYDPESGRHALPPEQALALADEQSDLYLLGAYDILASFFADEDRLAVAFRTGRGLHWHEHHQHHGIGPIMRSTDAPPIRPSGGNTSVCAGRRRCCVRVPRDGADRGARAASRGADGVP
jgi:hypothetical protein